MSAPDNAEPRLAVIVLTLNQRVKTLRCLESLLKVRCPVFRVILWDNGSTDGTAEEVRDRYPDVLVRHSPVNLGASSGRNAAVELALKELAASHLLFLDNDAVVASDSFEPLLSPFRGDGRLAQTSAKIRFLSESDKIYDAGGSRIRYWLGSTAPTGYGQVDRGQYEVRVPCIPPTGCMMVRASVFREVRGFDPIFDPYGYEDLDFSLRIRRAGYYALYVPDVIIHHDPGRTPGGGRYDKTYAHLKRRNWFIFMRRHASLTQQLAFFVVGAPLGVARLLARRVAPSN